MAAHTSSQVFPSTCNNVFCANFGAGAHVINLGYSTDAAVCYSG